MKKNDTINDGFLLGKTASMMRRTRRTGSERGGIASAPTVFAQGQWEHPL